MKGTEEFFNHESRYCLVYVVIPHVSLFPETVAVLV